MSKDKWPPDAFLVSGLGVKKIPESAFETAAESLAGSGLALSPIWKPPVDLLPLRLPDYIDDKASDEPFVLYETFTDAGVELGYRRSYVGRLGGGLITAARQIDVLKEKTGGGQALKPKERRRLEGGVTSLRILNTSEVTSEEWDLPPDEIMLSVRGMLAAVLDGSIEGEKGFGEASTDTLLAISRRFIKSEHID